MKKPFVFVFILIALLAAVFFFLQKPVAPEPSLSEEIDADRAALNSTEETAALDAPVIQEQIAKSEESMVNALEIAQEKSEPHDGLKEKDVLRASNGGSLGLQMKPLPRGKAKFQMEDREVAPQNLSGHYQRVLISGESKTRVQLQWPGVGADRPVFVHAIHGGKINGKSGDTFYTTGDGELAFNFTSSPEAGRYEILLRSGPSEEVLHFWIPLGAPEIDRYGL